MTFDAATTVGLLVSFVIPLLVGLVTKLKTPPGVKAVILLFFTSVTGVLTQLVAHLQDSSTPFQWQSVVFTALIGFVVAVAGHFGLWKPTGAAEKVGAVGSGSQPIEVNLGENHLAEHSVDSLPPAWTDTEHGSTARLGLERRTLDHDQRVADTDEAPMGANESHLEKPEGL